MNPMNVSIPLHSNEINVRIKVREAIVAGGALPYYDGEYEVIAKTTEQILETENKSMRENVVVKAIPYTDVSNPSGGRTINIAYD